jgi:hypothetical protein
MHGFTLDLIDMSAADVIRQAVLISGKSQEVIEAAANLRPGILDQYSSRNDHHWPNMLNLPGLCQALGNDLLIRWQAAQFAASATRHAAPDMPASRLMRETVLSAIEFGDFARAVETALGDDKLTRKERMAIRREAQELAARLLRVVNSVSGGL